MPNDAEIRRTLLTDCLEASRLEVLRRLRDAGLPTSAPIERTIIVDRDDGGWQSDHETINVSAIQIPNILIAIRDETIPFRLIGLRPQLLPLAEHLHTTTSLGEVQQSGFVPQQTGPDAIIARYLSALALQYIAGLEDVDRSDDEAVRRLSSELDLLCDPTRVRHTDQLLIAGVTVADELQPYRGVGMRGLTSNERGAVLDMQQTGLGFDFHTPDFIVPRQIRNFVPSALLEITTTRRRTQASDRSELANRVVLAFYLCGFDLRSLGLLVSFDEPRWASMGIGHTPFPVADKLAGTNRMISQENLREVIDLAYKMPSFGSAEASGREIVLSRVLRGCGGAESGFLDFAIALEAALLGGANTELAYRFSLYGALFLQSDHNPKQTFKKLTNVYKVRSKLVHGSRVAPDARQRAERDAAELAKAVTRKALDDAWPSQAVLNELALTTDLLTAREED